MMLHRRCIGDDGFGVGEALKENDRVEITLWGLIESKENSIDLMRRLSITLNHHINLFYSLVTGKYEGNEGIDS